MYAYNMSYSRSLPYFFVLVLLLYFLQISSLSICTSTTPSVFYVFVFCAVNGGVGVVIFVRLLSSSVIFLMSVVSPDNRTPNKNCMNV